MSFEPKIVSGASRDDEGRDDVAEVVRLRVSDDSRDAAVGDASQNSHEFCYQQPEPVWDDAQALELSDDLALLAEQLVTDANFLARRHPADATPQQRAAAVAGRVAQNAVAQPQPVPTTSRRGWRQVSFASAAAAILVVAGIASLVWNANQNDQPISPAGIVATNPTRPHVAAPALSVPKDLAADGSIEIAPGVRTLRTEPPAEEPVANPTEFLRGVSGPELDGMLDLLEPEETGLSI